ncbi:MAG: saccharopine dehydrogenase NADP-binding domain-containing protein [bacterium]|nr:saccharopine dehydrogenase NADP-binding domain-containing protein [bacterium]
MKVFIVGSGATGSVTAKVLAGFPDIEQVIIGDINEKNAKKFLVPDPKIEFKILDATKKDEVVKQMEGSTILINAAAPNLNKLLMEIALEVGANYLDMASSGDGVSIETTQPFSYDEQFKEKGLVALLNASASPGVTNLMAGELASGLKQIEYIKIRILEDVRADVPLTAWSKEVAFDEFTTLPYVWDGEKFATKDNFDDEEVFDFPAPFINTTCYMIAQEDIGTLSRFIKTKYADFKAGGSEIEFARTLFQLGLMKKRPIKVAEQMVSPYQFLVKVWPEVPGIEETKKLVESDKLRNAHFWASVEVSGTEAVRMENLTSKEATTHHKKKTLRAYILFPNQSEINKIYPGANYVSYAAGLSAAIFAETIPSLAKKGVYPPEAMELKDCDAIIGKLRKNGIKIEIGDVKMQFLPQPPRA